MKTFAQYLQELASPPLSVKHPYWGKYPRGYEDTELGRETMEADKQTHDTSIPRLRVDRRYDDIEDMRARRDINTGKVEPVNTQSGKFGGGY